MKIQTFSIVVGTRACNAKCPFCVSRMTGFGELPKSPGINKRNLRKAVAAAKLGGTTTVLLTGKGEPTLYPREITDYLRLIEGQFPFMELQTNALEIGRLAQVGRSHIPGMSKETLQVWYQLGLDTIAISVVDVLSEVNARVYHEDYPPLEKTIRFLHDLGFSVRLCVMMAKGGVENPGDLERVVRFCKDNEVDQLTVRPVRRPASSENNKASDWVKENGLSTERELYFVDLWFESHGTQLMTLTHGAKIYDIDGQNVCLADCLTVEADSDDIRTLIFFGDGRIAYDWQYHGALLLGPAVRASSGRPG